MGGGGPASLLLQAVMVVRAPIAIRSCFMLLSQEGNALANEPVARDGTDEILDPEGIEFLDLDALRTGVLKNVRDVMSGDIKRGVIDFRYRIEAEDEAGTVVHALHFKDAVDIIPAD